jgi:hypothetical protein
MGYQLIETVALTSSASSIEFTSVPQDGVDLLLKVSLRHSGFGTAGSAGLQFNADTGSNYSTRRLQGTGSTTQSNTQTAETYMNFFGAGGSTTADTFNNAHAYIANYTSSSTKAVSVDLVIENNATASLQVIQAGSYTGTSALSSLKVFITSGTSQFVSGSTASLYKVTAD